MQIIKYPTLCLIAIFLVINVYSASGQPAVVKDSDVRLKISSFEDKTTALTINEVLKKPFKALPGLTPNYNLTKSVYWFKIHLINNTDTERLLLKINNGTITSASFYTFDNDNIRVQTVANTTPFSQRKINSQYPLFDIRVTQDSAITGLLRVSSTNVMDLPISVNTDLVILESLGIDQWYFGIYAGIILVMFLYNSFLCLIVRDKNYLYYVLYILVVGLTQACLKGYAPKFLWPDNRWLITNASHIITALSGVFSILFAFSFLHIKKYIPKGFYLLCGTIAVYFVSIGMFLNEQYIAAQQVLQANTGLVSITILVCGFIIFSKGYKPALFFNISWSFFLSGVIIYILKDAGVLPVNNFTSNAILIGSALEVALLSFALADKINIYKKEKEQSQEETVKVLKENERIVREQNVLLEVKVNERTQELSDTNTELNETLIELKNAQGQLVEAEKMASLGQLTAGIAHEINNPINFVTSNINPLRRDIDVLLDAIDKIEEVGLSESKPEEKQKQLEEYKEEIDLDYLKVEINHLLKGINEGASRTAEIVKGLRVFSRLDEDDLKRADINQGLDSTLTIVNNLLDNKIKVKKDYGEIPLIECYPGKLNQVFLNIISNAIHAIKKRHGNVPGGEIKISTSGDKENVFIKISDNGTGMDETTKKKVFEPFFTTKDVGEGTGLGMSIVYNTIKRHEGEIDIHSTPGEGTEFVIKLPVFLTILQN
ncbi:MAG TPA: 7TM diverse intracellular signaling domain-containing protein [Sphingobacteriaceae bacterium]|nr:7TM diverse intracellular signaling domain-containing protein [Sphingobacteriaceae bacterium]